MVAHQHSPRLITILIIKLRGIGAMAVRSYRQKRSSTTTPHSNRDESRVALLGNSIFLSVDELSQ